jgi:DNA-binding transcriptional ArsR family regulator
LKEPSTFTSRREGELLAERAQMSQPTITRHLEILKRVGLVYTTHVGPWNFQYRDQPLIDELPDLFAQV